MIRSYLVFLFGFFTLGCASKVLDGRLPPVYRSAIASAEGESSWGVVRGAWDGRYVQAANPSPD